MGNADEAFEAALREIEKVRTSGQKRISFDDAGFQSLTLIPEQIADLHQVERVDLGKTAITELSPLVEMPRLTILTLDQAPITDFAPLALLKGLEGLALSGSKLSDLSVLSELEKLEVLWLDRSDATELDPLKKLLKLRILALDQTGVTNLTPIAAISALKNLRLNRSLVTDLAPLAALTGLEHLVLDGSRVADLRPIAGLDRLGTQAAPGLSYSDTPALADPELARLSSIKGAEDRTRLTLDYLKTLPPWPEPLPWLNPPPDGPEVAIPSPTPAPLQVVEIAGVLRPAMPGDHLDEAAALLARQGWSALRDFLADLAEIRPRIVNQMPTLARALTRFEAALGTEFQGLNAIALGTHGNRIIAQSPAARDTMTEAEAAEIEELAAAIALFLARFPAWRDYLADAGRDAPDRAQVEAILTDITEIATELEDDEAIDPAIPESLREQVKAVLDQPDDTVTAYGLVASARNVLGPVLSVVVAATKIIGKKVSDFVALTAEQVKKLASAGLARLIVGSSVTFILAKAGVLSHLGTAYPSAFGWILPILRLLGL